VDYDTVWQMVQMGGAVLAGGLGTAAWLARRRLVAGTLWTAAVAVGTAVALTIAGGESWRMNDPGLRIMWQLIQSSVAAVVLLAGLVMVFGVRGGNVLIHVAVGLLMVGQFLFGDRQIEERISLIEGQTTSVAYRTDETELAVIDPSDAADDRVTVISGRLLAARAGGEPITVDALPFDIRVITWFPNSSVIRVGPVAPNPATAGLGKQWLADGRPPEGGTSSPISSRSFSTTKTGSSWGAAATSSIPSKRAESPGGWRCGFAANTSPTASPSMTCGASTTRPARRPATTRRTSPSPTGRRRPSRRAASG
jgi:hypothetical protein